MAPDNIYAKVKAVFSADVLRVMSLFVANRLFLFGVGVMSVILFSGLVQKPAVHIYSSEVWLQIWGSWDTGYFLATARHGYGAGGEVCRFPLYPLAIRAMTFLVGDYFIAAVIVSNLALIVACIFLYRLMSLEGSSVCARNACKYLLLFPSSCILSGAFSESLFLAVMLGSFYYARKRSWLTAGLLGLCTALTRSIGCLIVIPLFYEYMRSREFHLRAIKLDVLSLVLVPMGTVVFFSYLYVLTGSFFAYTESATQDFDVSFHNPLSIIHRLWFSFHYQSVDYFFNSALTIFSIVGLTVFIRKIGVTYWLLGMLLILVPLMSTSWIVAMSRYLSVVFPIFVLTAKLATDRPWLDEIMTIAFGMVQGFVMAMWVLDMHFVV